jgi:hypothetical protein
MPDMPPGDPYVEHVLESIPPKVAKTFTREQWDGLRKALAVSLRSSRHAVDIRFVLPLYIARIYCVLILGKDTRQRVHHVLVERRQRVSIAAGAVVVAAGFVALAAVTAAALYVVKSAAGIDFFANWHLSEWLAG